MQNHVKRFQRWAHKHVEKWIHGGCFTNALHTLQNILSKLLQKSYFYENFKLKLCTCAKKAVLKAHVQSFSPKFVP